MSLRWRLTLLLAGIVGLTVAAAWLVAGRAVFAPFAREAMEIYLDEAVFVADQIGEGADPKNLSDRLGLEITRSQEPPFPGARREPSFRGGCQRRTRNEREIVVCHGPRAPVAVQMSGGGWVTIRREIDFGSPLRRIALFFVLLGVGVLIAALYTGSVLVRPLMTAQQAMLRVAGGDLAHRLSVEGPPELEEAARAFNRMADRVNEMLASERELMAGISHELRTPLARLRLELELLREHAVPEKRLDAMEADVEELDRLIAELLEISRLELGERKIERAPVELRALAEEAIARARAGEADAERQIVVEGSGATVSGDRERLVRAVTNLLTNAMKYSPPDRPITVELSEQGLAVSDRGPGVPPEALDRLFEPFFRVPATRQAPGVGLGLTYARKIVNLHGGRIRAENRSGGGLRVTIDLTVT